MELKWQADWIWFPGTRQQPNAYFHARKSFELRDACESGVLHISAYTDYLLYINGVFVGRGPSPSNGKVMTYDTYDIVSFLLIGRNTIAVQAHNYGVGVHWNPAEYDDSEWGKPEIIGKTPVFPYERLIPRPIPFLMEEHLQPVDRRSRGPERLAGSEPDANPFRLAISSIMSRWAYCAGLSYI